MTCPSCQAPLAPGKAFCTRCGSAVCSTLTIDRATLARLLPTGLELSEDGRLLAGPVEVDPVRVLKPELRLKLGGYRVEVDRLALGAEGLSVNLRLA